MEEASDDEVGHLLDRWRQGTRDDAGWFRVLRVPMRRAAWRGIQYMTGHPPSDVDVDEALYEAFTEFIRRDPNTVTSPVGLARAIAFRRGQDLGRSLNKDREFLDSDEINTEDDSSPDRPRVIFQGSVPGPEDVVLAAEDEEEKEEVLGIARECLEQLPVGQAEVVRATILGQQNISDWAHDQGKSYQAADQQRNRALSALRRCIAEKRQEKGGDHVV